MDKTDVNASGNADCYVSYTRVYETSAGCLRSIKPSLDVRQHPLELIGIYVHINIHIKESQI